MERSFSIQALLFAVLVTLVTSIRDEQWYPSSGIEVAGQPQQPCSSELMHEILEAVRTLLPLKKQVENTHNQIQDLYKAFTKTKQYVESLEADVKERTALREEVTRLRSDATACSSRSRNTRAEIQGRCDSERDALQAECITKLMALSGEAQRDIEAAKSRVGELEDRLEQLNNTRESEIADVRAENVALRAQLKAMERGDISCQTSKTEDSSAESLIIEPASGRGGRGASDPWDSSRRKPKPSPGKTDSSVSKIPPSAYKHSCKGFTEPSAPVTPSPFEKSIRIENRQYLIGKDKLTWGEAWRACKARGMWIFTLETEQEQQQLEPHMMHIHNTPTKYWLFARKPQGSAWYSWECATSSDPEPWRLPTVARAGSGASVRCAHVELHAGSEVTWGDDRCEEKHHYICRKLVTEC